MNRTPLIRRRLVPVPLLAVAALLCALLTVTLSRTPADGATSASRDQNQAQGHAHRHGHHGRFVPRTDRQVAFHDQMRKLWEDHVTWTRLAIVTFADGSAGFDATAARLLQNQTDIGNAIKPFYGDAAGDQLTALLHDHITIAVELLQAAKAGDTAAFERRQRPLVRQRQRHRRLPLRRQPALLARPTMRATMKTHLDQTLAEAAARARRRLRGERRRLRGDPPPHPDDGRPAQRGHHRASSRPVPLTP